jgi:plasmid rolling circle replication initiator protein Rep
MNETISEKSKISKSIELSHKDKLPIFDYKQKDKLKSYSLQLAEKHMKSFPTLHNKNNAMLTCSNTILWSTYQNKKELDKFMSTSKTMTCKNPFCAICQHNKSRKLFHETYQSLDYLQSQGEYFQYYMLTLTIQNPKISDLKETINYMNKAFHTMFNTSNAKIFKPIRTLVRGYFRSLEYFGDNTKLGYAHPHYHVLLVMPKTYYPSRDYYITTDTWHDMWQHALGADYHLQVDIQKIRPSRKKNGMNAIASAVAEVVKYSTKTTDVLNLSEHDYVHLTQQTKNVRTFTRSKYFRDLLKIIKPTKEQIAEEAKQWELILQETISYNNGYKNRKKIYFDKTAPAG